MIYVFVDTNIWVRVLTQALPGCEITYLDALRSLVGLGRVTLLLPEIVELELEKTWRELTDNITRSISCRFIIATFTIPSKRSSIMSKKSAAQRVVEGIAIVLAIGCLVPIDMVVWGRFSKPAAKSARQAMIDDYKTEQWTPPASGIPARAFVDSIEKLPATYPTLADDQRIAP